MRLSVHELVNPLGAPAKAVAWAWETALGLLGRNEQEPAPDREWKPGRERAYDAYKDDDGKPRFAHSAVLLWDVLGVKAMTQSDDALRYLRELRIALDVARDRAGTEDARLPHRSTWFTDNVVLGTPVLGHPDNVEIALGTTQVNVAYMMLHMLDAGFLARGAITFGPHYMDESFVFGPALTEAAVLEDTTTWPRVVLSAEAVELSRTMAEAWYAEPRLSVHGRILACDKHGSVFVDHLGVWLEEEDDWELAQYALGRHKQTIEASLGTLKRGSAAWEKWKWLADFHNYSMTKRIKNPAKFHIKAGQARHRFHSFGSTLRNTPRPR